jgi:(1->4)-alpha-D-glucan 1-alpha-D-glucosylmutase
MGGTGGTVVGHAGSVPRTPQIHRAATYRVQLHAGFTFGDAAAIAGYLDALGVSHLYCSPYLQAAPGSTHGYDVTDHAKLNAELGGEAGHQRLAAALADHGLRQVLDIVPNHMALAGRANAWWWDVLENGPSSPYARYFDIDWDPPERKLAKTVLMPILGDHYGRVLEAGQLAVERDGGSFTVRYFEQEVPLSPRTLGALLNRAALRAGQDGPAGPADTGGAGALAALAGDFARLPDARRTDPAAVTGRHRGKEILRARLAALADKNPAVATALDAEIVALNRDPDALDVLLSEQNYRLAYWRTAAEEISYRRFFDIQSLAGLRVEEADVFADTHRLILKLVAAGTVDGLRVDHVDGLADPEGYLNRLREATGGGYVVVEKILAADEELPGSWATAGTSGYDFLNSAGQIMVDPAGEAALRDGYARFTGVTQDYPALVYAAKLEIMRDDLAAEVERLTELLDRVCEGHRRQRDHTRRELREALTAFIAGFGVYRPYARPGRPASAADRERITAAAASVTARHPDIDAELVTFLADLLMLRHPGAEETEFAVRFGQVSSPVMAKGGEDTAFYRYLPLISLNEVGGDPGQFGRPVSAFHQAMARATARWPEAMLTLSTHDTKRSADVRARISLLSELPGAWTDAVHRWADRNERHRKPAGPDRNTEYLLYQTLVGAWPLPADRAVAFAAKATREAKQHTSWTDPSPAYDEAVAAFIESILADDGFVADLESFLAEHRLVELGRVSSLAQTALLLTCPGIPDLYQGTEVWDLSLVDPDNRRPVDYPARERLLAELTSAAAAAGDRSGPAAGAAAALARADDGGPKLWLITQVLRHRRRHPAAYGPASGYEPLPVTGQKAGHAVAFRRTGGLAVLVPRLVVGLAGDWAGTAVQLPPGSWRSVLTGEPASGAAPAADLLAGFPVAVLAPENLIARQDGDG